MWKSREKLAKIFFIIFIFSLIFSCTCIMVCSGHKCIGEDCNICYEINLIRNIFDNLLILTLLITFVKVTQNRFNSRRYVRIINHNLTLVKLKVKISE